MFTWEDYTYLDGQVDAATLTCNTTSTLLVPDPGFKLLVYAVIVDAPSTPAPRFVFTDG